MKRVVKIKWFNLFLLGMFVASITLLAHDYLLLITNLSYSLTTYGAFTEAILFGIATVTYECFIEEMKGE